MPLGISIDNSAVADLALAIAKLTPLEVAAFIRDLKSRPGLRGVNWDVIMAGAVQAAAEAPRVGTGFGVPSSAVALVGQLGTSGLVITAETIGAAQALDVSDQGGVSNAALFDQTSGVNAPLDAGILDVTPWRELLFVWNCSGGTSAIVARVVDDAGVDFPGASLAAPAAALAGSQSVGPGCVVNNALPRRVHFTAGAAGVGNTVRLRIEGRR